MSNINKILLLAKEGDKNAQELLKLTYAELVLSDIHLSISNRMQFLSNGLGVNTRNEKRSLGAIHKASKEINSRLLRDLGGDEMAEAFGNHAEELQDLLMESVFLSSEDILKLVSTAKILFKK